MTVPDDTIVVEPQKRNKTATSWMKPDTKFNESQIISKCILHEGNWKCPYISYMRSLSPQNMYLYMYKYIVRVHFQYACSI